ncbi:hypothetical protein DIURU_001627 [Diutina rugosa]|uniref:Pyrroline-5-carboxylate reductase n=1 Tax=Diutina rugosa TaxID=5481 RepID=A0A642UYC3_DIURU|nr:uncharacterized protein DIURU_001627 [Diutina rugosa]KAA8905199.1 hypothetical protein DIURU_001627 [Diutina rugosa]
MRDNYTFTILGAGVMGTAVANAVLKGHPEPFPGEIRACTHDETSMELAKTKLSHEIVSYCYGPENNAKAVKGADVILLACKPDMYEKIHDEVKDSLTGDQLVISLLAGVTIEELMIFSKNIAKVMTNTPARFGCGTAGIAFSPEAEKNHEEFVLKLIDTVGMAFKIPEKQMDIATSLIGSGPAFCMLMMEALIDGGVRMGMPFETARKSAAKVMEGTAKMVLETGEHPAVLRSLVCTPGGTTIGGLLKMEDGNVRAGIARGVEEAAIISKSFSKKK